MSKIIYLVCLVIFSQNVRATIDFESIDNSARERIEFFVRQLTLKQCRSFGKCLRAPIAKHHEISSVYVELIADSVTVFIKTSPTLNSGDSVRGTRGYSKILPENQKYIDEYEKTLNKYTLQLMDQRLHDEKGFRCTIS